MNYKIALYQAADGSWCWYILHIQTSFNRLLTFDGQESTIRKAVRAATKSAKNRGVQIAYTYMERDCA